MTDPATPGPAPDLLERERELDVLREAVASASRGAGTLVLIEGPAGIGKTRLLGAAVAAARGSGIAVLSARGSRLEQEFSFGVVLQLLAERAAGGDDVFAGAASLARPLFTPGRPPAERLTSDAMFSLLHGLHWLVSNLADREPLLICVDDAHWADPPSLGFVNYLAQRIEGLPVVVAVAVRTGEPTEVADAVDELHAHDPARVLRPASLSPSASATRVRIALPRATDEFCDACTVASGGNPFYLRELIATAVADRVEPTAAGAGRVGKLGPDSISRAVLTRLGRLPGPARDLAEAVAVLGDDAPLRHAAELAGGAVADLVAAADRLIEADLLTPGDPVSFAHPIVGSAVYADLAPTRKAQVHLRAAEILYRDGVATETVASHLLNATYSGAEWVRRLLRTAAERAHARGTPRAALRYLRRALDEGPAPDERGELLALAGLAEAEAGVGSGTKTLLEAVSLIEAPHRRAQVLFDLALVLTHAGRYPHAARTAERARTELGGDDPALDSQLAALAAISRTYVNLTDADATLRHVESSLEAPGLEASPAGRAVLGNASIALAFAGASADRLRSLAERALNLDRPLDDRFDMIAFPLAAFGMVLAGDLDAAERASSVAVEAARRRGSILELGAAVHVRSMARFQSGRVVEALADAESAVEAGRWGWGATLPMAHAQLVFALLERGDVEGAGAALDLPGGEERWAVNVSFGVYLIARAAVWRARGESDEALDQLRFAGQLGTLVNARHSALLPWRPLAVEILLAGGAREEAEALAAEDLTEARAFGNAGSEGSSLRLRGMSTSGTDGVELLRESERVLSASPARLEHTRTLIELGSALRRSGELREAREVLKDGMDAAHRCGSTVLVDRAVEELHVAGARPRRPAVTGVAALTPAERRVAALAGAGLSNRDVAQRLFVTRRTVEMHLTSVYAKLGIESRAELPDALDESAPASP